MAIKTQPVLKRKRGQPSVSNGIASSFQDKDNLYCCPICFNTIDEPYVTKCGHSFCHNCLRMSLCNEPKCPKCSFHITKDDIFPNIMLSELVFKHKLKLNDTKMCRLDAAQCFYDESYSLTLDLYKLDRLGLTSVNGWLTLLNKKKEALLNGHKSIEKQLLTEFLTKVHLKKTEEVKSLSCDIDILEKDLKKITEIKNPPNKNVNSKNVTLDKKNFSNFEHINGSEKSNNSSFDSIFNDHEDPVEKAISNEGFNTSKHQGKNWIVMNLANQRRKMDQHFDDLEQIYFSIRRKNNPFIPDIFDDLIGTKGEENNLDEFSDCLNKFTRFSSFRILASLNYHSDVSTNNSIVSSIEFDRDCEFFAIAGVTKKIKVFEYSSVIKDQIEIHYPVHEIVCQSKISSIIWNSYHKNLLASSDYEGIISLWDVAVGLKTKVFQEHEKRCWSVDFNQIDPKFLASGSDDSKVKLWHTNCDHSIGTMEVKANVCCVKFNPHSRYHLTFGLADHSIHYYDLRNQKMPLSIMMGHKKAVSYAKFASSSEIISASTDSQLKLWDLNKFHCTRTFKGHINERNFVGLATDQDYIACGSENNSVYAYYKGMPKHLLTYKFETVKSILQNEKADDDSSEFVSAVCWKKDSNVLLSANSQGIIKVLELV